MKGPETVIYLVIGVWLLIAGIVIGYPLITGQIKAGLDPVSREQDPQAFWNAYIFSTVLFLAVSIVMGFFVRGILHGKT
jgi:Na+/proline symporter